MKTKRHFELGVLILFQGAGDSLTFSIPPSDFRSAFQSISCRIEMFTNWGVLGERFQTISSSSSSSSFTLATDVQFTFDDLI